MTDLNADPRQTARQLIRETIDPDLWVRNEAFTQRLVQIMKAHRLHAHPILEAWNAGEFTLEGIRLVHMEVRAAFLEVFTESLLRLMQTTSQLEPTLGYRGKLSARFLVQLNVLEELGFKPGTSEAGDFVGHPSLAHYWRLADAMTSLGLDEAAWRGHKPSAEAEATRRTMDENQDDHLRLAVLLAGIETVFMPYYSPWARNSIAVCPALVVENGYHSVHVEDDDGHFVDDDHSEDSWYVVRQALTPARYDEIERFTTDLLDTWATLFDQLLARGRELRRAA
ncbi:hypothetical protein V6768_14935 [Tistrella mobilis]